MSNLTVATTESADASADAKLARSIAAGHKDAFVLLMRRFNRLLYRSARSIVKNESDAEDVVQNAYLLAYRQMGNFRGDAKLSTWLVRIVINEAVSCLRSRARRAHVVNLDGSELDNIVESAAHAAGKRAERPDDLLIRSDMRRLLQAKIDDLPLAYRTVFMLRAVEELSVAETAASLGIPEATVRTRFFRARTQLCEALSIAPPGEFETAFPFAGERCAGIAARVMAAISAEPGR
jgi:RNA polymerase sigma-70 factor (ECF subfamily)